MGGRKASSKSADCAGVFWVVRADGWKRAHRNCEPHHIGRRLAAVRKPTMFLAWRTAGSQSPVSVTRRPARLSASDGWLQGGAHRRPITQLLRFMRPARCTNSRRYFLKRTVRSSGSKHSPLIALARL